MTDDYGDVDEDKVVGYDLDHDLHKEDVEQRYDGSCTQWEVEEVGESQVDSLRDCPLYCAGLYTTGYSKSGDLINKLLFTTVD